MDVYVCPSCGKKFLECDLRRTHCSENFVGFGIIGYCPSCFNPVLKKLEPAESNEFFEKEITNCCLDELRWN